MSIVGKLTGFLIGAYFGWPGILLGLLVGHLLDLGLQRNTRSGAFGSDSLELVRHLFALFGRVAGFGGGVNSTQVLFLQSLLQSQLQLGGNSARTALASFQDSVTSNSGRPWAEVLADTSELAREIYSDYFLDRRTLLWTYATCRRLAALGTLRPGIVELLDAIAKAFVIYEEVGTAGVSGGRPQDSYDEQTWAGFRPAREATPDAWATLGLQPGASDDEVKKAYRTLARKYHPDSHSHLPDNDPAKKKAAEQFLHVQQAYERISKSK
ncbi:MAG: J domain-containing protein [Spirochaetales bacterium]